MSRKDPFLRVFREVERRVAKWPGWMHQVLGSSPPQLRRAAPRRPRRMAYDAKTEEALLEATRNGPESQWVDRIALVYKKAGGRAEKVNWCQSPELVVHDVVDSCLTGRGPHVMTLLKAIESVRGTEFPKWVLA